MQRCWAPGRRKGQSGQESVQRGLIVLDGDAYCVAFPMLPASDDG